MSENGKDMRIAIKEYPELEMLCWSRATDTLDEEEAFCIYEANWRFVEPERLELKELDFIQHLVGRYGNGVLNV